MDMRARETSSRQNHRPLPAYLDVSALEKRTHTTPDRTRFSRSCARKQASSTPLPVSSFAIKPCSGSKPSATDPLHPNSNEIKVRSGVAERTPFFESMHLAASKPAASQPLAVKPFEIKASSGLAARTPFFVKKSKAAAGRAWIFHTFGGTEEAEDWNETTGTVREEEQAQEQNPRRRGVSRRLGLSVFRSPSISVITVHQCNQWLILSRHGNSSACRVGHP